jgi:hypothetical protein
MEMDAGIIYFPVVFGSVSAVCFQRLFNLHLNN